MSSGRRAYWTTSIVLSALTLAVGVAVVVSSVANGAGAISARLVLGVLIAAAGAGRIYVALRRGRGA